MLAKRISLAALPLVVGCLSGCAQTPTTPAEVEGTVTLKGQTLAFVRVEFMPDPDKGTKGPRSSGMTDEKGHYTLHRDDGQPGAVVGHYRVVISYNESWQNRTQDARNAESEDISRADAAKKNASIPRRFKTASTTTLLKEVNAGKQTIDLELTP